jgi:hypothetical protein
VLSRFLLLTFAIQNVRQSELRFTILDVLRNCAPVLCFRLRGFTVRIEQFTEIDMEWRGPDRAPSPTSATGLRGRPYPHLLLHTASGGVLGENFLEGFDRLGAYMGFAGEAAPV